MSTDVRVPSMYNTSAERIGAGHFESEGAKKRACAPQPSSELSFSDGEARLELKLLSVPA